MRTFLLVGLLAIQADPDAQQFVRMITSAMAELRDVSLIYETELRFVGPRHLPTKDPERLGSLKQGVFAYRSDGAAFVNSFERSPHSEGIQVHRTIAILAGKLSQLDVRSDLDETIETKPKPTNLAVLAGPAMPLRILPSFFFQSLTDAAKYDYRCEGWEELDGHRCLVVQLDVLPGMKKPSLFSRKLWLDFDRGGHALRIEFLMRETLTARTEIELKQFSAKDGRSIWLPVKGETLTYLWDEDVLDTPVFRERYLFDTATVRVNQGLSDDVFTIDKSPLLANTPQLAAAREAFAKAPKREKPSPVNVQADLDQALARAESSARQLDASRSAAVSRSWSPLVPQFAALVGVLMLAAGAGIYWRMRRA